MRLQNLRAFISSKLADLTGEESRLAVILTSSSRGEMARMRKAWW